MFVVELVGYRNHLLVPVDPSIPFVAADQQDRSAPWIEGESGPTTSPARGGALRDRVNTP
jgi:hypothetical protein